MYKDTFQMIDGDIVIEDDLKVVNGQEELRQNLENRISTNINEWFLNLEMGLDYMGIVDKATDRDIELRIRKCCAQDERVKNINNLKVERNRKERTAEITFNVITKENENLSFKEVVSFG